MRLSKYMQEQGEIGSGAIITPDVAKFYPYYTNKENKKKRMFRRGKKMEEQKLYEYGKEVAKTILSQIYHIDKWALGSWGARDYVSTTKPPGIQFLVRGSKFRGKVIITLNGKDLYDIEFGNVRMSPEPKWIVKHKEDDVSVENLVPTLDSYIG